VILTDRLVFLQLQKTAGTHIGRLLVEEFSGRERFGKHRPLPRGFDPGKRLIVGSIRNPWDWYVSLWTFGCRGRGGPFERSTAPRSVWNALRDPGTRRVSGARAALASRMLAARHEWTRPAGAWRRLHADPADPRLFREWLKLSLDSRRRFDLFRDFGQSAVSAYAGMLTFLYELLYLRDNTVLFDRRILPDLEALVRHDAQNGILDGTIRTENLEQDLLQVLERAGYALTPRQAERIENAEPTNTSDRRHALADFYDDEAREIVAAREALIVRKYGYRPTGLAGSGAPA
jgi:hypothetical protein